MRWPESSRRAKLPRLAVWLRRVGWRRVTIGGGAVGAAVLGALPDIADAVSNGEVGLPERYEPYRRVLAILLASAAATAASRGTRRSGSSSSSKPRRRKAVRDDDGAGTA